jgi:CHAT domain-containing protein
MFIGLSAGFLQLGTPGVLATLWPVNDASTALLLARFFHHRLGEGLRPAAALKAAQLWLKAATVQGLRTMLREAFEGPSLSADAPAPEPMPPTGWRR